MKEIRTPGIEPGTIRYPQRLQSNALPTELCSVARAAPTPKPGRHRRPHSTYASSKTTARGFEPPRAEPIGFRVRLLNHSDTLPLERTPVPRGGSGANVTTKKRLGGVREESENGGHSGKNVATPTVGLEPTTTSLKGWRSTN
jgi:hypothetical protein